MAAGGGIVFHPEGAERAAMGGVPAPRTFFTRLAIVAILCFAALPIGGCLFPASLPRHLGLGLMNDPEHLGWMTSSGIPWDYRYQYLTGGVNTGQGWTNSLSVDDYMRASGANGYIPVFTYYQIVPSAPDPWSEDVSEKLTNPSTMNAYFSEWKLLMQKAGAYGAAVVVQVEPDTWGYMESSFGANATSVPVSVSSSGFAEVAGFPNNAAGFAQALVSLRNTYARNVLLGFHVSDWATGKDLILNQADPNSLADGVFAFYQSLGVQFDLFFFDPADRDAGFYQVVRNDNGAHWWNDADFQRFDQFVGRLLGLAGKKGVVWQVPIGNTVSRSENNTWGHYQDNRVQYWLGDRTHLQALANDGVIAILFGAGASGCTMYDDDMGDGVTNPPPINGNDHQAEYADDDGGYLRESAAAYYSAGAIPY